MQNTAVVLIAAGLATGLGALVALHLAPTGLSAIRNAVSQYGITSYRSGYRIQTIGYAVAGLGAAIGIFTLPGAAAAGPAGLCLIFAAARALISWFPMDAPGAERTATGRGHGVLAAVAFVCAGLAAWQLARLLRHDGLHPAIATTSAVLAAVMAITLLAMVTSRRAGIGRFGLIERGFYLTMTAWLATVAVLGVLPG